jgi:hypothetical protein
MHPRRFGAKKEAANKQRYEMAGYKRARVVRDMDRGETDRAALCRGHEVIS